MGKIYWNNLDVELQTGLKKAVDNTLTPDGTTITKNAEGVISAVGGVTNSSGSFPSELEIIVPK